ncbi:MAG TPA: carboxypeptidase regulatory-like domain-containing protein [Xanthobacteraceae bacterium]|jgi:virginiamycin B lyase
MVRHGSRILAVTAAAALLGSAHAIRAADFDGSVAGVVSSASGQALPGAYVKLINPERRLTFMVVTQAQGRYTVNNLPPGDYTVQGIGDGFQSKLTPVTLTSGKPATADVSLTDKQGNVVLNGWVRRPGRVAGNELDAELAPPTLPEGDGKAIVESKCSQCHFLHRLTQMRWTRNNWEKKIAWMRERIHDRPGAVDLTDQEVKTVVDYLAKNFSDTTPKLDPNGRLSRTLLAGNAAKYIAVDFGAPNPDSALHDITVDPRGVAWVNELNEYKLGRFDPKTYEFTEVSPPPGPSKVGVLNHLGPPARGVGDAIWVAEVGTNRRWLQFDTKYQEFTAFPADFMRGQISGNFMRADPNGKMVWSTAGTRVVGLNIETKQFVAYDIPHWVETKRNPGAYGLDVAGDGKVWFVEREANKIARLDPATGKIDEFKTPGVDVPRRMGADWDGNLWIGFHETGKLVKVDQKTGKMTFYSPPTANNGAYHAVADATHKVIWLTEQTADKIARFDPKTETWTEFSLPIVESDARRIELDPSNPNRIWWSGDTSSHLGYIEVLDQ